jgi:hypothetical protein
MGIAISKPDIAKNCPNNLFDFTEQLRKSGLKVDNYPFRWEGFEYLIEPYKATNFDLPEDWNGHDKLEGFRSVWQCGAQVAKTTTGFILLVMLALRFWGRYFGCYYPDQKMSDNFSGERFAPMVKAIPEIRPLWGKDPSNDELLKQTDKKSVRSIGPSKIIFSYMTGVTSTEGWPLLGVIFDEVRKMMDPDIERTEERMSHSPYPINVKFSTAGFPDVTIDKAYKKTRQNKFHSKCRCPDGVLLADTFPDSIGEKLKGVTPAFRDLPDVFYICPICKEIVLNPRLGHWVPHFPLARWDGWHIPQTLSCGITPGEIYTTFKEAKNLQEFYNSKLGVAYLSKESQIINEDILRATINYDLKWQRAGVNCAMGIDQMLGFNVIVIRRWGPKTDLGVCKSQLIHLEIIYDDDPWLRCDELMTQFDVSICVADAAPNVNEALRFAKRWPGRVFLCEYNYTPEGGVDDICEWGDRPRETPTKKKGSIDTKHKYKVRANRYLGIEWNLMKYVNRLKEQPHEKGLVTDVMETRGSQHQARKEFLCENVFWVHLQKIVRVKEEDEETGEIKMNFVHLGIDPHFAHSDFYCELALSRVKADASGGAFSDYRKSAEAAEAAKATDHNFEPTDNPQHFRCSVCKLMVAEIAGMTLQQVADKVGLGECRGRKN